MRRKDTVIIAILINMSLLLILFATANRSDNPILAKALISEPVHVVPQDEYCTVTASSASSALQAPVGDEVDQVLSQWTGNFDTAPFSPSLSPLTNNSSAETMPPLLQDRDYEEVTVKKGDVLERIAKVCNSSVQEIMHANHLSSTRLRIGQTLKVPRKPRNSHSSAKPQSVEKQTPDPDRQVYTIRSGDSLWTIASKCHTTVDELLRLNKLDEEKARRLKPGDQIIIR